LYFSAGSAQWMGVRVLAEVLEQNKVPVRCRERYMPLFPEGVEFRQSDAHCFVLADQRGVNMSDPAHFIAAARVCVMVAKSIRQVGKDIPVVTCAAHRVDTLMHG